MANPTPVLDLNLASRPFRNNTLLWVGFGLGLAAVLALTVWNVRTYRGIQSDLAQLRGDMEAYDGRMQDLRERNRRAKNGIENHDLDLLQVQAMKANSVIELKAFSWTTLFNRLEEILPYNVKMQRVRPMFRVGRESRSDRPSIEAEERAIPVMIDGRAQDLDAFFDLQTALLASPYFERVEPQRQAAVDNEVEFALQFVYYPNRSTEPEPEPEPAGEDAADEVEAGADDEPGPAPDPPEGTGAPDTVEDVATGSGGSTPAEGRSG